MGPVSADLLPREAEDLRIWAAGQTVGHLVVQDVVASLDEDVNGQLAVFLDVVLPPPQQGEPTWNVTDVLRLHEVIDAKARELGLDRPWHVRLFAEGDVEADVDDEGSADPDGE